MHCLALRRDIAAAHPWLAVELYRAFAKAREISLAELRLVNVLRVSMPWLASAFEEQMAIMGGDPWPYGFARNRDEVAAIIRFALADGLAARDISPEELFHPSVLSEG